MLVSCHQPFCPVPPLAGRTAFVFVEWTASGSVVQRRGSRRVNECSMRSACKCRFLGVAGVTNAKEPLLRRLRANLRKHRGPLAARPALRVQNGGRLLAALLKGLLRGSPAGFPPWPASISQAPGWACRRCRPPRLLLPLPLPLAAAAGTPAGRAASRRYFWS